MFGFSKAIQLIDNTFRDKSGVWVGTRGLGSRHTPQFGPLHHAAIWIDGTLIEVSGKKANNKIILNIEHSVKIGLGVAPFEEFNWHKVAVYTSKKMSEIIDHARRIADCQYSVIPKSNQHNCQTFVREMLEFVLGSKDVSAIMHKWFA